MIGVWIGKVRSTPTPKETLRTVNVSPTPPPWRRMTTPLKTWTRERVPSTTLTCTLTVSPARNAGMSSLRDALSISSKRCMTASLSRARYRSRTGSGVAWDVVCRPGGPRDVLAPPVAGAGRVRTQGVSLPEGRGPAEIGGRRLTAEDSGRLELRALLGRRSFGVRDLADEWRHLVLAAAQLDEPLGRLDLVPRHLDDVFSHCSPPLPDVTIILLNAQVVHQDPLGRGREDIAVVLEQGAPLEDDIGQLALLGGGQLAAGEVDEHGPAQLTAPELVAGDVVEGRGEPPAPLLAPALALALGQVVPLALLARHGVAPGGAVGQPRTAAAAEEGQHRRPPVDGHHLPPCACGTQHAPETL